MFTYLAHFTCCVPLSLWFLLLLSVSPKYFAILLMLWISHVTLLSLHISFISGAWTWFWWCYALLNIVLLQFFPTTFFSMLKSKPPLCEGLVCFFEKAHICTLLVVLGKYFSHLNVCWSTFSLGHQVSSWRDFMKSGKKVRWYFCLVAFVGHSFIVLFELPAKTT